LIEPAFVCNPALKADDSGSSDVQRPEEHLACYKIRDDPAAFRKFSVIVQNQFGNNQRLEVVAPKLLCVPSRKTPLITPRTATPTAKPTATASASPQATPTVSAVPTSTP